MSGKGTGRNGVWLAFEGRDTMFALVSNLQPILAKGYGENAVMGNGVCTRICRECGACDVSEESRIRFVMLSSQTYLTRAPPHQGWILQ